MVKLTSQGGKTLFCSKENLTCLSAQFVLGFREIEEKDIEHHQKQFGLEKEKAIKLIDLKPKLKVNEFEGVLLFTDEQIEPDAIILIVDSAQALPLIESYTAITGKEIIFRNGISSAVCSYGIVITYQTNEPNLSIPCVGAKRFGLFQDFELIFTFPYKIFLKVVDDLLLKESKSLLHLPVIQNFL